MSGGSGRAYRVLRPSAGEKCGLVPGEESARAILISFLALLVFYWLFCVETGAETPGMRWVGLRVVSFDGQPLTAQQRFTRAWATVLSTIALGLGFFWSLAD